MSYIDCFDHEYIGHLGYLPIYHPLEVIEGERGAYDFGATPANLVLGGGSGEHSGLVLHKLECFAATYLAEQLTEEEEAILTEPDREFFTSRHGVFQGDLLEFCEWRVTEYASITAMARNMMPLGGALGPEEDVEAWIIKSIGELVWFSLPDLNPDHERLAAIVAPFKIDATLCNVTLPPPGYPKIRGRRVVDNKVAWGLHRWN